MPNESVLRVAHEFVDSDGRSPFREWLLNIKDVRSQAKITKAIVQMEAGNFGDFKAIKNAPGLLEKRLHFGPGYRIYCCFDGAKLIILLAGSGKSTQRSTIELAKKYLDDYRKR